MKGEATNAASCWTRDSRVAGGSKWPGRRLAEAAETSMHTKSHDEATISCIFHCNSVMH